MIHVFSNNIDYYFENNELSIAIKEARKLCRVYGCVRVFEGMDEDSDGDCILSFGEFPQ